MADKIEQARSFLEGLARYHVRDDDLLLEAINLRQGSEQRVALLGRALLEYVILDDWYSTGASKATGDALLKSISGIDNLASIARLHGIERFIFPHGGQKGVPLGRTSLSDTVKALIAAVYLDSGKDMDLVRSLVAALGLTEPRALP
ncbi:hypothetical protein B0A50_07292 [Salinomyces thailandicus]|uniref:RNase III domain-containing protein n=1 Tax=Salinomyces thailandicus TaxID=706561 RepID=A0A4U0TNL9_9PEZI|nr:hypothetical protein B0A50_07292 [Salinomyces thailandica]